MGDIILAAVLALHTITVTSLCPALCPGRVRTRLSGSRGRRPGEGRGIRVGNFSCPGGGMQDCQCQACYLCKLHNLQPTTSTYSRWIASTWLKFQPSNEIFSSDSHNPNFEYLIVISIVKYSRREVNIYVDCYGI